jgi:hypothetical protein
LKALYQILNLFNKSSDHQIHHRQQEQAVKGIESIQLQKELEKIRFHGHENILGTHKNTLEITKDDNITKRADCIVGVQATKGCADLNPETKQWLQEGHWIEAEVQCAKFSFSFIGKGKQSLDLEDPREIVLRKSDFTSPRTLAVGCSKSAQDMPREMIKALQIRETNGLLIIRSMPNKMDDEFFWNLP